MKSASPWPALPVDPEGRYFLAGVESPESTERLVVARDIVIVRPIDVSMKMIADQVVRRVSTLAAPRGPNAVCEPCPPNAPARSADLPCCRSTTPTRNRQ